MDDNHPSRQPPPATIRLLHLTDPHLRTSADGIFRGVKVERSLRAVCTAAFAEDGPFRAILLTGDLVQDEVPAAYRRLREALGGLGTPVHCIPGNHDDPPLMHSVLAAPPFDCGPRIDFGDWQIAMLSTHVPGGEHGHLEEAALESLEQLLAHARHVLICLHHHPVPVGSRWLDALGLDNAAALLGLIERYDSARGVLWGHVHQAFEEQRDGVLYMASPSTCAQFRPRTERFTLDQRPPGYRWLALGADGRIETAVRWVALDRAAGQRDG